MTVPPRGPRLVHITTEDISLRYLLLPQLEAYAAAGFDVWAMSAPGPNVAEIERRGIRHVPLEHSTRGWDLRADLRLVAEVRRKLRELRPDIVHTHNPKTSIIGRIGAKAARVPHIVGTIHGLYALPDDPLKKRVVVYSIERFAAALADVVFVINTDDEATMRSLWVRPPKLDLLPGGVPLDRFDPGRFSPEDRRRTRQEIAGDPDALIFGIVTRLVWEKGLRELFEAAGRLRATHPDVRVVVVGPQDPVKTDGLSDADISAAEADGVVFLGERDDVEALYAAFDVFVLPSYREGYPRAAMEAAAMGVPLLTTTVRGCKDVAIDGVTGVLIPPRDATALAGAMAALADDRPRLASLTAESARLNPERFDERRTIDHTMRTYERLLGTRMTPQDDR